MTTLKLSPAASFVLFYRSISLVTKLLPSVNTTAVSSKSLSAHSTAADRGEIFHICLDSSRAVLQLSSNPETREPKSSTFIVSLRC